MINKPPVPPPVRFITRDQRDSDFDAAYKTTPPWEIGRAQPALAALVPAGPGALLDIGCGTGELAMLAASRGYDATGVDQAVTAIAIARRRAAERDLTVGFRVDNALALPPDWAERFDLVVDSGVFHVFGDEERLAYVQNVASVVKPGGRYVMLCFSDRQAGDWGPRRVSEAEIRSSFADGWRIDSIEAAEFELAAGQPMPLGGGRPQAGGPVAPRAAQAWLAQMTRT
jgi:SAM-dependent methyltransferase